MNITLEVLDRKNLEACRELCNELMTFQKSKAFLFPEKFDIMNFDTRMKSSSESALECHTVVVKDEGVPVGYVFSTIDYVQPEDTARPSWAPSTEPDLGFYPDWVELPQKIGCLSNLYLREQYRSLGLGSQLFQATMSWLESFTDLSLIFVFISNGNDAALDFYVRHGFTYSHDVFGGFIKAAYMRKTK